VSEHAMQQLCKIFWWWRRSLLKTDAISVMEVQLTW